MEAQKESNIRVTIANNITRLMELHNKSRRQVCEDLDIKYTTFCDWVNAKTSPKPESLELLGYYFGVGIHEFFIELEQKGASSERLVKYAEKFNAPRELSMSVFENMSDADIKKLLAAGYRLKHKTLEERLAEFGGKIEVFENMIGDLEPVGSEIW